MDPIEGTEMSGALALAGGQWPHTFFSCFKQHLMLWVVSKAKNGAGNEP